MEVAIGALDRALLYVVNALRPYFRNVQFCFLELEHPSIAEGIELALLKSPNILIMIPYFLHRGIHIKRDLVLDIKGSLENSSLRQCLSGKTLGCG